MSDNPTARITQSLVAEIVSSYVKNNQIAPTDIPALINRLPVLDNSREIA